MYEFDYHKPVDVAGALETSGGSDDGLFLAGGQTIITVMKQRLAMPSDVIDLNAIDDLCGIRVKEDVISIGAMCRHADVASHSDVRRLIPGLADLAGKIGDPHVRNRGTLGGSIANNDPAADYPAAVVALGATVHTNLRDIAAGDFFTDLFETALKDSELIIRVTFPVPEKSAYEKILNPASRFAMVGVFVSQSVAGVRVAVTGAGPCVFQLPEMEDALMRSFSASALEKISINPGGLNSDLHGSAEYRAHLIGVAARRAVTNAC